MSKVWFTSDLHFGHRNIIGYADRPFRSIEEHDAALVHEWNLKVAPEDEIYFLGDLTLDPDPERCLQLLRKLPGQIHVVLGNHDRALKRLSKASPLIDKGVIAFRLLQEYSDVRDRLVFLPRSERVEDFFRFKRDGRSCVLTHHPLEDWPGMALHGHGREGIDPLSGRWHLHGHSHGLSRNIPGRLDVGWDLQRMILSWAQVQEIMAERAR